MSYITLHQLVKNYTSLSGDDQQPALAPTSLAIKKGEFFAVVGSSGAGKSTLLNLLAGFEQPTSGTVTIAGAGVTHPHKRHIAIFQESALFPWLSVQENVMFPLSLTRTDLDSRRKKVRDALALVNLTAAANKFPRELSGGMRQRAQIARALVVEPEILFMDEPFAALDEPNRLHLESELLNIWCMRKMTIVFVTHHIESALLLADRVAVMKDSPGRIEQVLPVGLPRPRDMLCRTFGTLKKELLQALR